MTFLNPGESVRKRLITAQDIASVLKSNITTSLLFHPLWEPELKPGAEISITAFSSLSTGNSTKVTLLFQPILPQVSSYRLDLTSGINLITIYPESLTQTLIDAKNSIEASLAQSICLLDFENGSFRRFAATHSSCPSAWLSLPLLDPLALIRPYHGFLALNDRSGSAILSRLNSSLESWNLKRGWNLVHWLQGENPSLPTTKPMALLYYLQGNLWSGRSLGDYSQLPRFPAPFDRPTLPTQSYFIYSLKETAHFQ